MSSLKARVRPDYVRMLYLSTVVALVMALFALQPVVPARAAFTISQTYTEELSANTNGIAGQTFYVDTVGKITSIAVYPVATPESGEATLRIYGGTDLTSTPIYTQTNVPINATDSFITTTLTTALPVTAGDYSFTFEGDSAFSLRYGYGTAEGDELYWGGTLISEGVVREYHDLAFIVTATDSTIGVEGPDGTPIAAGDTTPSSPEGTQFGTVATGQTVSRTFTIRNGGSSALTVNSIGFSPAVSNGFSISGAGTLPLTVAAGGTTTFSVNFAPTASGTFTGTVAIATSDAVNPSYTFDVAGSSGESKPVIDSSAPAAGTYGDAYSHRFTATAAATFSSSTLPPGLTLDSTGVLSGTPTLAGPYTFTVTATNAIGSGTQDVSLTIKKRTLTVVAEDKVINPVDAFPPEFFTFKYGNFAPGDTASVLDTPPAAISDAPDSQTEGLYVIYPDGGIDANYDFNFVPGTLEITSLQIPTITWPATLPALTYGDAVGSTRLNATASVTSGTFSYSTVVPSGVVTASTVLDAGLGQIIKVQFTPTDTATYVPVTAMAQVDVARKALTITADDKEFVRGQALPALTATFAGLVNGDTAASLATPVQLKTAATTSSTPGAYAITAGGASDPNYTISYVNGTIRVRSNTPVLSAVNGEIGGPGSVFLFELEGFAKGEVITIKVDGVAKLTVNANDLGVARFAIKISDTTARSHIITAVGSVTLAAVREASTTVTITTGGPLLTLPEGTGSVPTAEVTTPVQPGPTKLKIYLPLVIDR